MRTNIVIDPQLMAAVMATGEFQTKREAVEAGLRLIKRRKTCDELLSLRGKLHWDDSDECWAAYRALHAKGYPIRSPIDVLQASNCITHDHLLLHRDADFDVMETLRGLKV